LSSVALKSHMTITTNSAIQTENVGRELIGESDLRHSLVVFLLKGDLGSGKTQCVKGIAKGLGIEKPVVSPSFTYIREYEYKNENGEGQLVHIDAWRVEEEDLWNQLGIESFLKVGNVLAIEWPKKFVDSTYFASQTSVSSVSIYEIEIKEVGEGREIVVNKVR